MSRFYSMQFGGVSVSAAQDFISIKVGASIPIRLHQFEINSESSTAPAELRVQLKRMTATVTIGSGGTTMAGIALDSSDSTSSITTSLGHVNDTARATTSGSSTVLMSWGWNVLNGLLWVPAPEWRPTFQVNEGMILGLETAPGGATTMDGYLIFEEIS